MFRPACVGIATLLAMSLACFGNSTVVAQDEKKPGKKPPVGKPEKGDKKKPGEIDDEMKGKGEAKSDGEKEKDKASEPTDEKQKKQFDKIRLGIEKKFKKASKEQVYVYTTHEKIMERIESTSEPQAGEPGKGRTPNKGRGTVQGGASAGEWEPVIKNVAYLTKDREDAIEKVYKFLVEYPPPLPGAKKKKSKEEEGPPPPERSLTSVQSFPATKEGEKKAEAAHEQLDNKFRKEQQQAEWKKQARKKGA